MERNLCWREQHLFTASGQDAQDTATERITSLTFTSETEQEQIHQQHTLNECDLSKDTNLSIYLYIYLSVLLYIYIDGIFD